ncbi:glutamine cyclotransferase [Christiangramia fulva]|uniref:Glutamine cyclotransferase n=1 Tax=Christiangramia fulva TaxID=2126553 RepID=A0A2R3Z6F4_9FLAO|nr:glutaminyl-peptide cyclotransferase [Christiangramia fulva]AVR45840.1 glutamine cyclotransferase [Christiangramia fulva]
MLRKFNFLSLFILCFLIISCGSKNAKKSSPFSVEISGNQQEFKLHDQINAGVKSRENIPIDSLALYLGNDRLQYKGNSNQLNINLDNVKLGSFPLKFVIFSEEGTDTLVKNIKILNDKAPVIYTYEIVNTYPHDITSYTQGLEFHDDFLYESTGLRGQSKLRKENLETGEILKEIKLDDQYFAEGLTILNGKIYQLTWQSGEGIIYDLESFEKTGIFSYNHSKEGWGLCNDGEVIYKSDGTDKIWVLDPQSLEEKGYIEPTHHKSSATRLNELEWVEGEIYANTWQKDGVAIINPENGAIDGLIDFSGLREKVTQHEQLDVLNGIAYNPETKKLYVTGKNWDKIFEVKIVKK